jgi:hypothetical protein
MGINNDRLASDVLEARMIKKTHVVCDKTVLSSLLIEAESRWFFFASVLPHLCLSMDNSPGEIKTWNGA